MLASQSFDLFVVRPNRDTHRSQNPDQRRHSGRTGSNHGLVECCGYSPADVRQPGIYAELSSAAVLKEEFTQSLRPCALRFLQRRPSLQKTAGHLRSHIKEPVQHLREVHLQASRQPIRVTSSVVDELAPLL